MKLSSIIRFLTSGSSTRRPRRRTARVAELNTATVKEDSQFKQGYYTPKYPEKYRGDTDNIIFRSGWERAVFEWCDWNPHIRAWASEELAIEYFMKGVRYQRHYYPDLLIYFGRDEVMMVEIKPDDEKQNPDYENRCKWAAARSYCREKKGWRFVVWGESTINKRRAQAKYWKKTVNQS